MNNEMQKILEEIYKNLYPRHLGKSQGMRTARVQCKSKEKLMELEIAIRNYRAYLEREKREPQYILYFSTFMNQWRDWLDPEHGKCTITNQLDLSGMGFEE